MNRYGKKYGRYLRNRLLRGRKRYWRGRNEDDGDWK